jgi:uncharacterized membrane protein YozB (DUF420 family)
VSLPALNASLNALACLFLCAGLACIKRGARRGHVGCMLSATLVSALFLASYLYYHFAVVPEVGHTLFRGEGLARKAYYLLLVSHVLLAAANVPLVGLVLWRAARRDWPRHRQLARVAWPVWFYVSVTGVLVYFALYRWNPVA